MGKISGSQSGVQDPCKGHKMINGVGKKNNILLLKVTGGTQFILTGHQPKMLGTAGRGALKG